MWKGRFGWLTFKNKLFFFCFLCFSSLFKINKLNRIYFFCSLVLVVLATIYEIRQINQSGCQSWSSSERNRPKSFFACFSARYNIEQVMLVKSRHMYEMATPIIIENDHNDIATKEYNQVQPRINSSVIDGLKVFALFWICISNYYFLGYQPQLLGSVGELILFFIVSFY